MIPMETQATLFLLCGKIASGKSTLAASLASKHDALIMAEDEWLSQLYDNKSLDDYIQTSTKLRTTLEPLIIRMLARGINVVLDFQANTVRSRTWLKGLITKSGTRHELHYLDVPNEVCKARLKIRNVSGQHPYDVDEKTFEIFTSHFLAPQASEGFYVILHAHPYISMPP